jgi:hypothetical protein
VEVRAESLPLGRGVLADAANVEDGSLGDAPDEVASELDGEGAGGVGLRDEESVPNPLAELETDAVEEVVRDPVRGGKENS